MLLAYSLLSEVISITWVVVLQVEANPLSLEWGKRPTYYPQKAIATKG
jgi:hypothetical protein